MYVCTEGIYGKSPKRCCSLDGGESGDLFGLSHPLPHSHTHTRGAASCPTVRFSPDTTRSLTESRASEDGWLSPTCTDNFSHLGLASPFQTPTHSLTQPTAPDSVNITASSCTVGGATTVDPVDKSSSDVVVKEESETANEYFFFDDCSSLLYAAGDESEMDEDLEYLRGVQSHAL